MGTVASVNAGKGKVKINAKEFAHLSEEDY